MSGTVNKATILGRLGKDPEIKTTHGGQMFAMMSVATEETWRDKQSGERKKKTEWHRIVCFNEKLAEIIEKWVRKGSLIYIEGQITTRKWTDQSGAERYTTEIVMPKFGGTLAMLNDGQRDGGERQQTSGQPAGAAGGKTQDELDDDIPF